MKSVDMKGKRMSKENESAKELFGDSVSDVLARLLDESEELHLRREIERMADKIGSEVRYEHTEYFTEEKIDGISYVEIGPYTLQQCHDKLREISGED